MDLDNKDFTAVTNNFSHSLFSQCNNTQQRAHHSLAIFTSTVRETCCSFHVWQWCSHRKSYRVIASIEMDSYYVLRAMRDWYSIWDNVAHNTVLFHGFETMDVDQWKRLVV